jgi:ribosomal protein S25
MKPVPPGNLWEAMDAEYQKKAKPENSFSIPDLVERYKITYSEAERMTKRLENEGKIVLVGRFGSRNAKTYQMKEV